MVNRFLAVAVGAVATVAVAGPAMAGGTFPAGLGPSSAKLYNGQWYFNGNQTARAGFVVNGSLKDTAADSDWVYLRGKVDGYGFGGGANLENHNGAPNSVPISQEFFSYDPAQSGKIQVCRHRTGAIPNDCVESDTKYR